MGPNPGSEYIEEPCQPVGVCQPARRKGRASPQQAVRIEQNLADANRGTAELEKRYRETPVVAQLPARGIFGNKPSAMQK
jgi:hypothetical protein